MTQTEQSSFSHTTFASCTFTLLSHLCTSLFSFLFPFPISPIPLSVQYYRPFTRQSRLSGQLQRLQQRNITHNSNSYQSLPSHPYYDRHTVSTISRGPILDSSAAVVHTSGQNTSTRTTETTVDPTTGSSFPGSGSEPSAAAQIDSTTEEFLPLRVKLPGSRGEQV